MDGDICCFLLLRAREGSAWAPAGDLTSPSLCHGLPFWGYLFWLWRFFCPPSANLHSKGSVGAAQKEGKENKMMFEDLHLVTHQRDLSPSPPLCISFQPPSHLYLSISSSTLPPPPPKGALRQNSRHNEQLRKIPKSQSWQPVPTLALAGSL